VAGVGVVEVGVVGFVGAGIIPMSTPIGAKGLGRPSLPSGINSILESLSPKKDGSENIESSNCRFRTLRSSGKNSPMDEFTAGLPEESKTEEVKGGSSCLSKTYKYPSIKIHPIPTNSNAFFRVGLILIL
jgi:hypothetical protein